MTEHHANGEDMTREEFRKYLKNKMEGISGTRNLKEANRRADVLLEWRCENGN